MKHLSDPVRDPDVVLYDPVRDPDVRHLMLDLVLLDLQYQSKVSKRLTGSLRSLWIRAGRPSAAR